MAEQVRPSKDALLRKLRRILGREHLDAVHVDIVNILLSPDCWSLTTDALMEAQIDRTQYPGEMNTRP